MSSILTNERQISIFQFFCNPAPWSLVGKRAEVKRFTQNWGPRITAIPLICTEGIIDIGIYEGNMKGATFHEFVTEKLCLNVLPFDGRNPRSVVILG